MPKPVTLRRDEQKLSFTSPWWFGMLDLTVQSNWQVRYGP
jgi:hypothetical protein